MAPLGSDLDDFLKKGLPFRKYRKNMRKTQVSHGLEAPGWARSAPDDSIWEVGPTKMDAQRIKREVREIKVGPISSSYNLRSCKSMETMRKSKKSEGKYYPNGNSYD